MVKFREFVEDEVIKTNRKKSSFAWNETIQEMFKAEENPKRIKKKKEENYQVLEVGFGLSKKVLKRPFDYIKSWLIRYKIPYEAVNPYLTLSMIEVEDFNKIKKPLIQEYKKISQKFYYEPKSVILIRDDNYPDLDFISIDFKKDFEFNSIMNEIYEEMDVKRVNHVAFLKLFSIPKEEFPLHLFEDMVYSMPTLPSVKIGNIGFLWRNADANV
jgi:hypothetical protein